MNVRMMIQPLVVLGALVALSQVAHAQDEQTARMRAALAVAERSQENKARDADRKPIETVKFLEIKTGDTAVDFIAESGYLTEVLAAAVGPKGHVYMQNPPFLAEREPKDMIARLGNVQTLHVPFTEAGLTGKIDDVVTAMTLHDVYNGFGDQPGGEAPAVELLKAIYAALKPGGVLGVIDHVGIAGQDNAKLHRMLPQQARDVLMKAGFTIEAESNLLANPADDHTKIVFDPSVRGHTDQFMFRARKPR